LNDNSVSASDIVLHDLHPAPDDLLGEVVSGLVGEPKTLPCKYFYDDVGSHLFDQICDLDEYYVTRTELGILSNHVEEMSHRIGPGALLVELGSGSSTKTHVVLDALKDPAGYVPVDISRDHLMAASVRISRAFPSLDVKPVCADFTERFSLPEAVDEAAPRFVFFPGSTIGNFDRASRQALLEHVVESCGVQAGGLLIGIDLIKDRQRLEAAYNDAEGVTAAFNLNLLDRINQELGADFDVDRFRHQAVYNGDENRIEMYLVSESDQVASIDGRSFEFGRGERICTEHSHKFSIEGFTAQAADVGLKLDALWTDAEDLFAILLFKVAEQP